MWQWRSLPQSSRNPSLLLHTKISLRNYQTVTHTDCKQNHIGLLLYSRDSPVGIALGYGLDDRCPRVRFPTGSWEFFSSPPRQKRLWGPPSLLCNGYQGLFPWGLSGRGAKLTTHPHLVPRSKNECSYTSTPQYAFMAWCLAKAQGQLYLYLLTFTNQEMIMILKKVNSEKALMHRYTQRINLYLSRIQKCIYIIRQPIESLVQWRYVCSFASAKQKQYWWLQWMCKWKVDSILFRCMEVYKYALKIRHVTFLCNSIKRWRISIQCSCIPNK
jgi:hypothetical protein